VPYLYSSKTQDIKEANAVLRGMNPYLLQQVKELFSDEDDRQAILATLQTLMKSKQVNFEDLGRDYGKTIERKMLRFALDLEPFALIKEDYSGFVLNEEKVGLNDIIINSLIYSVMARNDALDVYANAIAGLVEKDRSWYGEVAEESKDLTRELISKNQRDLMLDV
jgi:hypothetical protein